MMQMINPDFRDQGKKSKAGIGIKKFWSNTKMLQEKVVQIR